MFVALFIETDADDLLAEEQDRKRRAHGRTAYVGVILSASGSWAVVLVNLAAGKARAPMPTSQVAYMISP